MLSLLSLYAVSALAAPARTSRPTTIPSSVPSFVVDYAPIVRLYSGEKYLPSDLSAQLANTRPELNYTAVSPSGSLSLANLNVLNSVPDSNAGRDIYLTSLVDPATDPTYLFGVRPDAEGRTGSAVSCAVVTYSHPSPSTYLDAFYFYFYAFNYGGSYKVVGVVDDHVGDWEHNMVRFNASSGLPVAVWYSQHSSGEAFAYPGGVELARSPGTSSSAGTKAQRPVSYSANGTHANYATSGKHDHTIPGVNLPFGPIEDVTDAKGSEWDPTLAAYYYSWEPQAGSAAGKFTAYNGEDPTGWLEFLGHWGDDMYPKSDPRQKCFAGVSALCKWSSGPTGPEDKDLDRTNVCPNSDTHCKVLPVPLPKREADV